jgi:hypothetical protein
MVVPPTSREMKVPHAESHPLAGKTVKLNIQTGGSPNKLDAELEGQEYVIEDYWDKLTGGSWMDADGNPACLKYAMRSGFNGLPLNNEVVYGKVYSETGFGGSVGLGHLVHVSELGEVVEGE